MLVKAKITSPTLIRRMKGKSSFVFNEGINLLIGPNGSGKSTLLRALQPRSRAASSHIELELSDPRFPLPVYYHSAESVVTGAMSGSSLTDLQTKAESHGQTMDRYLASIENQVDPAIFLIDEPETALSAEALFNFGNMISTKADEGIQFIIATHSPILMCLSGVSLLSFGGDKDYRKTVLNIYRRSMKLR